MHKVDVIKLTTCFRTTVRGKNDAILWTSKRETPNLLLLLLFFNKTLKRTNKGSYFHSWGEGECGEQMGFYSFLRLTTISHNSLMDCF